MHAKKAEKYLKLTLVLVLGQMIWGCGADQYPSPLLYEPQVVEFEKRDRETPPPENAVLFFGSSSIQLWSSIQDDMYPVPVIARGFYGNTMNEALYYADRMMVAYNPAAIVIYEGDNDVSIGISPEKISDVYRQLVERIRLSLPSTPIYFISIKPSPNRWKRWPQRVTANELIAAYNAGDETLHYIDVASSMLDAEGDVRDELFVEDGIHLNESGYAIWANIMQPIILDAYNQAGN